jgi:hypothetical protein
MKQVRNRGTRRSKCSLLTAWGYALSLPDMGATVLSLKAGPAPRLGSEGLPVYGAPTCVLGDVTRNVAIVNVRLGGAL